MAYSRRQVHHRAPSSSLRSSSIIRKTYSLRRAATRASSHASTHSIPSPTPEDHRPVLVPLHLNLRRLPSRLLAHTQQSGKDMVMRDIDQVIQVGTKRKRVAGTNENALSNGRPTRYSSRRKRLRTTSVPQHYTTDNDYTSDTSDMDVDTASLTASRSELSKEEDEGGTESENESAVESSTDDYLLHEASSKELSRLRKSDLVRLYELAGLSGDAELLTKQEIVDCLIGARDDFASLPPSSPPGHDDAASSDYFSDDGNVAGGEETDSAPHSRTAGRAIIRRRTTLHDAGTLDGRMLKNRSMSMGNLANHDEITLGRASSRKQIAKLNGHINGNSTSSRNRSSTRSSQSSSTTLSTTATVSPSAIRTRLRKTSVTNAAPGTNPSSKDSHSMKGKGKVKLKQAEPRIDVGVRNDTYSKEKVRRSKRQREKSKSMDEESDLTDLDAVEESMGLKSVNKHAQTHLSPRRLRSRNKDREALNGKEAASSEEILRGQRIRASVESSSEVNSDAGQDKPLRVTPMRQAKRKITRLREETEEEDEEVDQLEEEQEEDGSTQEDEETLEEDELSEGSTKQEKLVRAVPTRAAKRGVASPRDEETEEEVDQLQEEQSDDVLSENESEEIDEDTDEAEGDENEADSPIGRRTPLKKRLRSRTRKGSAAPTDGDIEDEGEDDINNEEDESDDDGDLEDDNGSDTVTIAVVPRKLRSGKIVGDEDMELEEENVENEEEDEEMEAEGEETPTDTDAEGETDRDEAMEEVPVDLAVATARTLVRLRRDDLVRLCETRDLEPVGTKPQLAEALLQWRDRHVFSSPSSSGTVRPPSTAKKGKRVRRAPSGLPTPVLLRSERVHEDEPRTPIPDQQKEREREGDQELELDLETLGLEDREIPPDKLIKLEKIGSGGFKDVFIGKLKGRRVAIAEFRGSLSEMDIKELKLLGGFDHPNIVRFLGVSIPENTKETPVMIVSELCSNGDLFDYIRNTSAPSLYRLLNMMLDIARGLEYLHTRKPSVIHRDCKSSNILITSKGVAKIADFGLAKVKSTRSMVRSVVGTVNWQAPELWDPHPKYNHKADVFSCAMVYWEMLQWHFPNKKFPWEGMNEHAIYKIVGKELKRPSVSGLRKQWCPEIVDLMERMWAPEPQDRPTMTEVVRELEEMLANI